MLGSLILIILIAGGAGLALWLVNGSHNLTTEVDRSQIGAYDIAVLGVVTPIIILLVNNLLRSSESISDDEFLDKLADAIMQEGVNTALRQRLREPAPLLLHWKQVFIEVTEPSSSAVASDEVPGRFEVLPGLSSITAKELREGSSNDLHRIYGGLGSGRLLIIGEPGSGKSVSALLLMIEALQFRRRLSGRERRITPVPISLTLEGWKPDSQPLMSFLANQLHEVTGFFDGPAGRERAVRLLSLGRVSIILDSVDELPQQVLPHAINALSDQATFRFVVLGRTSVMTSVAAMAHLAGTATLEISPVESHVAADYLDRSQIHSNVAGFKTITDKLRDDSKTPFAHLLTNPLIIGLVRDICADSDQVEELLELIDETSTQDNAGGAIEEYLLDRYLAASYRSRVGYPSAFSVEEATRSLHLIAAQIVEADTQEIAWWHFGEWVPQPPRILILACLTALLGLGVFLAEGVIPALLAVGTTACLLSDRLRMPWKRHGTLTWRELLNRGRFALTLGLIVGASIIFVHFISTRNMASFAHGFKVGFTVWMSNLGSNKHQPALFQHAFGQVAPFVYAAAAPIIILTLGNNFSDPAKKPDGTLSNFWPRSLLARTIYATAIVVTIAYLALTIYKTSAIFPDRGAVATGLTAAIAAFIIFLVGFIFGLTEVFMRPVRGGCFIALIGGLLTVAGAAVLLVFSIPAALAWVVMRVFTSVTRRTREEALVLITPVGMWRRDMFAGLSSALVSGCITGVSLGVLVSIPFGSNEALAIGSSCALGVFFGMGIHDAPSWSSWLIFIQLTAREGTPIRLLSFLEDARARGVLRVVGPVYQFRHSRLRDRLAAVTVPARGSRRRFWRGWPDRDRSKPVSLPDPHD
jgi:hypothetical protein